MSLESNAPLRCLRFSKTSSFSDHIVLSMPSHPDSIIPMVARTGWLCATPFESGMFTRGAMTSGQLHHRGNVVFGQALVDAYGIESQLARYPRILVSSKLAGEFLRSILTSSLLISAQTLVPWFLREDFDGMLHLNYLSLGLTHDTLAKTELVLRSIVDDLPSDQSAV